MPVSRTVNSSQSVVAAVSLRAESVIAPLDVNFAALLNRLKSTWRMRVTSEFIDARFSSAISSSVLPFSTINGRMVSTAEARSCATSGPSASRSPSGSTAVYAKGKSSH